MNLYYEYLLLLITQISKQLMKIQNETRSQLSTSIIGTKLTPWRMVEMSVYNILHGRKSEEYGRISAVNLRCVAPILRKATETEGLVK